jgi:hypothetical protein
MFKTFNLEWGYIYEFIKFAPEFAERDPDELKQLFKWAY